MMYHVYKLQMSDAAIEAVNEAGNFSAHRQGKVYADLRHRLSGSDHMPYSVMSAALMGMYHHGLTVRAASIDAVFDYDNGHPSDKGVEPIYHCHGLPSMSVGDVIIGDSDVLVCAPMGWVALPKEAAIGFADMAKRTACQRPNALPEAA